MTVNMRIGRWWPLAAILPALAATPLTAQTRLPGDPHADDPVGILADACPDGETIDNTGGYAMWNLHMLTRDFGQLCRYRAADQALARAGKRPRVVFMGDSITDIWRDRDVGFWQAHPDDLDRGISGQTTPQMLVRFRQDVIDLRPRAVVILAGTNDIAGNTGAETMAQLEGNIATMAELARAHRIKVILASVTPASAFPWAPDKHPAAAIAAVNAWLQSYARALGFTWLDYHAALVGPDGGMKPGLSSDGVHPTAAGYAIMGPLAVAAIRRALGR